jgi:hypothetical protein
MSHTAEITYERRNDALNAAEADARAEIRAILTEAVRKVQPSTLNLDYVTGRGRVSRYSVPEVVTDFLAGSVLTALLEVLHKSDCPHVQAWRESMATAYADIYAAELANIRTEGV